MVGRARRVVLRALGPLGKLGPARAGAVLTALAAVIAFACGTPYGEARLEGNTNDAAPQEDEPPVESCPLHHPVEAPAVDDDPVNDVPPFVLAIDHFSIANTTNDFGYDIDNVCTCDTRDRSIHDAGPSCLPKKAVRCDGDGGVDNSFNDFIQTFPTEHGFDDYAGLQDRIATGRQTFLIHIRRYNGLANDRDVEVGLLPSDGIRTGNCPGSVESDDGNYPPQWCGDDAWTTFPDSTFDDGLPVAFANGYVHDYQFAVTLTATIQLPFGPTSLEIGSSIITGKLVPLGEDMTPRPLGQKPTTDREKRYFRIEDGKLVGRMSVDSLLGALGAADIGNSQRLCQSPLYLDIRKRLCESVDVARTPGLDFEPGYLCDSMSTAIGYTARPALQGVSFFDPGKANDCLPVDGGPKVPTKYATVYTCSDGADASADAAR